MGSGLAGLHLKLQGIDQILINEPATQLVIKTVMGDKEGISGADTELMAKDTNLEWELNDDTNAKFSEILEFAANDLNSSVRFTKDLTAASLTIASHESAIPDEFREDAEKLQHADKGEGAYKNVLNNYRRGTR